MIQQDGAQACAKDLMTLSALKVTGLIRQFKEWLVDFEAFNPTGGSGCVCIRLHLSMLPYLDPIYGKCKWFDATN